MAVETYGNLGATTLSAGYTAGSNVLTVTATAGSPAFPAAAPFRIVVIDQSTGAVTVILKVTAITDGTHFAVIAEGSDANANSGDFAYAVLTAGAIDGIRAAIQQSGAIASLPSSGMKEGDIYRATDDVIAYRRASAAWEAYGPVFPLTPPGNLSLTDINTPSKTVRTNGSISLTQTGSGAHNIVGCVIATPSTPYTITAAMIVNLGNEDFAQCGLMWRASGSGKIVTVGPATVSGRFFSADNFDSVSGFNGNEFRTRMAWPSGLLFIRISDDGSTRTMQWSYDGVVWITGGTAGHTDFITPDQVGFYIDSEAGSLFGALTLIHWKQT